MTSHRAEVCCPVQGRYAYDCPPGAYIPDPEKPSGLQPVRVQPGYEPNFGSCANAGFPFQAQVSRGASKHLPPAMLAYSQPSMPRLSALSHISCSSTFMHEPSLLLVRWHLLPAAASHSRHMHTRSCR